MTDESSTPRPATGRSNSRKPRFTQQQQQRIISSVPRNSYRSQSPFGSALKTPLKGGSIMRTRSLDDHHQDQQEEQNHNPPLSQEYIDMMRSNYYEGGSASSCCTDEKDEGTTVATALHSSFDVSLLRGGGAASCSSGDITLFENGLDDDEGDSEFIIEARNTSFDQGDSTASGNYDRDHHHFYQLRKPRSLTAKEVSYMDLKPPATIRKTKFASASRKDRRKSSDTATTATTIGTSMSNGSFLISMSKTPARTPGRPIRHMNGSCNNARTPGKTAGLHKSPAPSSTAKRRRDLLAHPARLSPMRRVGTLSPSSSAPATANTPTSFPPVPPFSLQYAASSAGKGGSGEKHSSFSSQTPIHQNLSSDAHGYFLKKLPYHTGTTPGTTLETTFEADGDSVDTNSPARFRFTSFPASLPRVHHASHYPRTTPPVCPGSVRKRMSFDTEEGGVIAERAKKPGEEECNDDDDPVGLNYSIHDAANNSKDDDGTQNTSLSSLSVEGGHHQHLPHLPHQHPPHFASVPMKNLLLFPGERDDENRQNELNNNLFGYSDDEEDDLGSNFAGEGIAPVASPDQEGTVRRTRLNFNVFLSPMNGKKSSNNPGENEFGNGKPMDLIRNVDLSRPYETQNRISSFPSSLSSHTHINASTHTNEENLIVAPSSSSISPPRTVVKNDNTSSNLPKTPREVHLHFPLESECSPILGGPKHDFVEGTGCPRTVMINRQQLETISSAAKTSIASPPHSKHLSHQKDEGASSISSSSESTTTTHQKRRVRPMPDMSAFENVKTTSTRAGDRSVDDSTTVGDSRGMGTLTRRERACPPTPQRTPAWANEGGAHAIFPARKQNSLIMNKVLLSCPTQVLEGRCSLETSVLDEDSKHSSRGNSFLNSSDSINNPSADGGKNLPMTLTNEDDNMEIDVDKSEDPVELCSEPTGNTHGDRKAPHDQIAAPPKLMRRLPSNPDSNAAISFSGDFEILGSLGSGAFADVYKVRQKSDDHLYAVKRNRRQFRGKRDRDVALAEVQSMQRLQSVFATNNNSGERDHAGHSHNSSENRKNCYSLYLLFFYRAWQEDGYFYSQTELCCRDTCRELLDSLRFLWNSSKKKYPSLIKKLPPPIGVEAGSHLDAFGRLVPNVTVWKICHDISAGLSHIHSHGIVHQDIKPSNIFFVANARFGAMCKIGDFGLAGSVGSSGDGQEGDGRYMPPELLASATRHTSSDIFSLGLTLYEIATDDHIEMPSDGPRWHHLRSCDEPKLPACRGDDLQRLLQSMTDPDERKRPTADAILENTSVNIAGHKVDTFLQDYIRDVEEFDRQEDKRLAMDRADDQTPRNDHRSAAVRSPSLSMLLPGPPNLFSPSAKAIHS